MSSKQDMEDGKSRHFSRTGDLMSMQANLSAFLRLLSSVSCFSASASLLLNCRMKAAAMSPPLVQMLRVYKADWSSSSRTVTHHTQPLPDLLPDLVALTHIRCKKPHPYPREQHLL
ncbi:MAG: hypothetical protein FRX48_01960 [Lasallia pustulata]|uniref:Uncharacterized protein n=1 Tax=Lasallia pustulata TaxID=136370 RepID=A0A5M8Q0M2_9LECA|nr:MAG: hypothetical protein FRX48_01960 [Lasallia pustulata]